ncbi:hypothetical protein [Bradyrhizobium sp. BRP23]|uniref:hypothetical protein n=1 Tax=Bradyrhizobium sp. BRP23 TaxID=2793820 RepID=UPI001CD7AE7F|nr:hypothetical protein [Bradyrhizobium sp. BRP23]MCA1379282.1 hypothetical protein [Bradyrhizobium sp. BRP05]MCA1420546.1 hypothetical protein [Bradyrhizobium sp. BRP23]
MNDVFVMLGFLVIFLLTIVELRTIRLDALGFSDGILIGAVYYVLIPLLVVLFTDNLSEPTLHIASYDPYADLSTTLNLYLGLLVVLLFHVIARLAPRRRAQARPPPIERNSFRIFLFILILLEVTNFFLSGKGSGGHWAENAATALSQSPVAIFSLGIQNCLRTSVFGYLIYQVSVLGMPRRSAVLIGGLVVILDVALTFNRITVAYFIMMIALLFRDRLVLFGSGLVIVAPTVTFMSSVWAVFRGLALSRGVSVENILIALQTASFTSQAGTEGGISRVLNAFAEASNILVFKFLVENVPDHFPPLWGQTFVLKSFSFFIPSTIWEDKPKTFGTYLGYYMESTQQLTLNSTLFGEAYGNFHYFWPLALIVMLLFLEVLFRRAARFSSAYGFFATFIAIALWRFDMTFAFISIVAIAVLYIGTEFCSLLLASNRRKRPAPIINQRPSAR